MAHVMILGGGFGGLAAAHELRSAHPELDVTLVDRRDSFYMGFAKLWDLGGVRPLADGTRSLTRLADRGVRFVQADITAIDPETCAVDTDSGRLEADALLIALGGVSSPTHLELLSGPSSHDLYDAEALPAMHAGLDSITQGTVLVSILGGPFQCPPAPYEAALLVDQRLRDRGVRDTVDVAISTPQPMTLPVGGVDASHWIASHLGERDIELLAGHAVTGVDTDTVTFADGTTREFAMLLGVPASAPPPIVTAAGLSGDSGFIEPDPRTLRTNFTGVYAVGDCTHVPNAVGALPKAGVFAAGEAVTAVRNIAADLLGTAQDRFDGLGRCFLELPGERVAFIEGDFLAEPNLDVVITEADHEKFLEKQASERDLLDTWLG